MNWKRLILLSLCLTIWGCSTPTETTAPENETPNESSQPEDGNSSASEPDAEASDNPLAGGTCAEIISQFECARDKFLAEGDDKSAKSMTDMITGNKTVNTSVSKANEICQDSYKSLDMAFKVGALDREKVDSVLLSCK